MEIKLSGEQFLKILTKHYGVPVTGFIITDADPSPIGDKIQRAVCLPLDKSRFVGNIKSLRDTIEKMGKRVTLAEARWAVENWTQFLDFVNRTNRLPEGGYGSGEFKGILL